MHKLKRAVTWSLALWMLLGSVGAYAQPSLTPQQTPTANVPRAATPPAVAQGAAPLTRADLEPWLDGFMPFALARGDIAGAVVVVVRDGEVLLQKGYGYADVERRRAVDPDRTLFRPGSVSKLFTWTAVMQLVEAGRLDLDEDVNTYLDFEIPELDGRPITLRKIMTHTAGFEEAARYTIVSEPGALDALLKTSLPRRIFPPGETPAYSNYATALAGYIVARASGLSFEDYMDRRVLGPLGMTRSTFRQPLPVALAPLMSNGYDVASGEPKPFEIVGPAPAGSLSATGADMARFMIAHLNQGEGLLRPDTARLMHDSRHGVLPPLNGMALGFYEQNINGRRVIAHGGDTQWFHSDLSLFLEDNVGLYISVNSTGAQGAAGAVRSGLFQQFANRYFPAPLAGTPIDADTAREHARMMVGVYANSRGFKTSFLSLLNLAQPVTLGVDEKGRLVAPAVTGLANQPRDWIEIAPFVWRDALSGERIAAEVVDGEVVRWSFDAISAFMVFDRVPAHLNGAVLLPALLAALVVLLLTGLAWPIRALARRRFKAETPFEGRRLNIYRSTAALSLLAVLVVIGWATFIGLALTDFTVLSGGLDGLLWSLQILSPLVFVGLCGFAGWNLWLVWTEKRGWFTRLWGVLLLAAAVIALWVALGFHMIGFGTNY